MSGKSATPKYVPFGYPRSAHNLQRARAAWRKLLFIAARRMQDSFPATSPGHRQKSAIHSDRVVDEATRPAHRRHLSPSPITSPIRRLDLKNLSGRC